MQNSHCAFRLLCLVAWECAPAQKFTMQLMGFLSQARKCAKVHKSAQKLAPTAFLRPPWRRWMCKGGAEDRASAQQCTIVHKSARLRHSSVLRGGGGGARVEQRTGRGEGGHVIQALRKRPANVQATFCVLRAEAIHWARDVLRAEAIHWACEWKASTRMPKPFSFRS